VLDGGLRTPDIAAGGEPVVGSAQLTSALLDELARLAETSPAFGTPA
jgi:hypothetical protein